MLNMSDMELLRDYDRKGSEEARFSRFTWRRLSLITIGIDLHD